MKVPGDTISVPESPDEELVKEVYARFGLCMYCAQVFETGLINILTLLETSASRTPTRWTFDSFYKKYERLTFGQLMAGLETHKILPPNLANEIRTLKLERDHLAHQFFRDHVLDFQTAADCHQMIENLKVRTERFSALDERVTQFQKETFARLGFDPERAVRNHETTLAELLAIARKKYEPPIPKS
ncbi:MAG: hypothetical protein KGL11_14595 [Alphaproteobacteria bacterium]|nr:hypothetical protein [Alphaproteobacteria bacterium]